MPLQGEIIPFTLPSGTGASGVKVVNHIRYPNMAAKGIVFLSVDRLGTGDNGHWSLGVDDGVRRIAAAAGATHHPFGWSTARGYSTQYSIHSEQSQAFFGGAQIRCLGYVSAITVGSFTVQMDNNGTPGAQWYAVVIGGTGVLCQVGLINPITGPFTATLPFEPVALVKVSAPNANSTGEVAGASSAYGFATLCGQNQVGWGAAGSTSSFESEAWLLPNEIQASPVNLTTTTIDSHYRISAWTPTGFTVGLVPGSGTGGGAWNIGFLAIGGPDVGANLVKITQPALPGTVSVALEAADPRLVFFGSVCRPHELTPHVNYNLAFGACDGVSQVAQWMGLLHGTGNQHSRTSTAAAVLAATASGDAASTLNAQASCTLGPHTLSLNFTVADVVLRETWALVLGNKSASSDECGGCLSDLTLTDMTYDCPTKLLTITGSGFTLDTQLTVRDPVGDPVVVAVSSVTPTTILGVATLTLAGEYCVEVSDPPPLPPVPPGPPVCAPPGFPWPPGPGVDPTSCPPFVASCLPGAPQWFIDALLFVHATICFDMNKLFEIEAMFPPSWAIKKDFLCRAFDPVIFQCVDPGGGLGTGVTPCAGPYKPCIDWGIAKYYTVERDGAWDFRLVGKFDEDDPGSFDPNVPAVSCVVPLCVDIPCPRGPHDDHTDDECPGKPHLGPPLVTLTPDGDTGD